MQRDDAPTVAAIAILAGCAATVLHEAIGHGAACLAWGGEIQRLTSVYFDCSVRSPWIAAGGPIGNVAGAALGWLGLAMLPAGLTRARLFAGLLMGISVFWIAGYLPYAAVLGEGDPWWVLVGLFGAPSLVARAAMVAAGIAFYGLGIALMRRTGEPLGRLRLSWLAASLAALAAALAYAPDRLGSGIQGALQIGGACFPLLLSTSSRPTREATQVGRSWPWLVAGMVGLVVFIATIGRGLP